MVNEKRIIAIAGSLIVVSIILIIAITIEIHKNQSGISFLDGYWDAPVSFCHKAGIKTAQCYFSTDNGQVYILMEDDNDSILINNCIGFSTNARLSGLDEDYSEYDFTLEDDADPLPREMVLRINPKTGFLGLYRDKVLHLELYKNHKASNGIL